MGSLMGAASRTRADHSCESARAPRIPPDSEPAESFLSDHQPRPVPRTARETEAAITRRNRRNKMKRLLSGRALSKLRELCVEKSLKRIPRFALGS